MTGEAWVPDRCDDCRCDDCGGRMADHLSDGCGCDSCAPYPGLACTEFLRPERIRFLDEQLAPLLSPWLNDRAAHRCLAVAHAAHHALLDYDRARETPR